jgi:hypothetical protein
MLERRYVRFSRELLLRQLSCPIEIAALEGSYRILVSNIHVFGLGGRRHPGQSAHSSRQLELVSPPSGCSTCAVM